MMVTILPGLVVIVLLVGALLCALSAGPRAAARVGLAAGAISGLLSVWLAASVWIGGPVAVTWWDGLPLAIPAALAVRVDALGAIFLVLLAVVPAAVLLHAQSYLDGQPAGPARWFFSLFLILVAAMSLVVMSADWVLFLFAWEVMTLASYFLVIWDWKQERHARAAWTYLLTTHVTSSGILVAVCSLSLVAGDFSVGATAAALAELFQRLPGFGHLLVAFLVLGFITKAAVWPFSFWLPEAYRAAPTPATAVYSGLMAKMGIYGLVRVLFFMLPGGGQPALVWGLVIATLGTASMLVGNIRSLSEQDAKRLVAQSSIGQIGYIVLGLGMAVALSGRAPLLAAVAFAGALYHLINHAAFKSLLFLTVGAVEQVSGTLDLRRTGGLLKALPFTAGLTLLGALAIAGTPPLNGFASKWLLYRAAVFGGFELPVLAVYGVIAIFISTVSLAAYLKYFGTVFLGPEREYPAGRRGPESPAAAASLGVLGTACVLLGLFPAPVVQAALAALQGAPGTALYGAGTVTGADVMGAALGGAGYQPLMVVLALALCALLVWLIRRLAIEPVRFTEPWFGGERLPASEARYGSEHLYRPFLARWAALLRPWWQPSFHAPPALERAIDLDRWLLGPVYGGFQALAGLAGRWHGGRVKGYVGWQLLATVVLIAVLIGMEGGLR
ncbi:hydrogenase-4 component B [Symbiobacterium terraclitae]|uniref:Hydrogenase-4 component B n=1 Tax=Symbiobacterium terraclitae TaxID=557451 RepID=A0ABS4JWR0_9FIRM|nr:proton-conducting transporter membrane subunit [Symbiobacterium terraclitae]MBP2018904.1 hydrogenase-4 component B [Symbiobacterium terraclitae]